MTTVGTETALDTDVVTVVRQATEAASRRPRDGQLTQVMSRPIDRLMAPVLGLYLGYAVVRLPEVFSALAVPHLPMMLMLLFIAVLAIGLPAEGWNDLWRGSRPLKIVVGLLGLVAVTTPLGIWPSNSIAFLQQRFVLNVVIFVCCLVFLRNRQNLRVAVSIYVLATAAVSLHVVRTYDPNAIVLNDDGEPIDPDIVAANPELRRLQSVGISLDPNDFGAVIATTFPLALWLAVGNLRRRVFWSAVAGLMVLSVVPTQSRGSELGIAAAAAVALAAGARGWRRWLSAGLIVGCAGVFIMMATGIGASGRFADFSSEDYNVAGNGGRLYFWRQGLVWMLKRPWGYGIDNYSTYFGILNGQERAAHSSWVQYGMELGVAGLLLFTNLCAFLVKGLRDLRKRAIAVRERTRDARDEEILAGHMLAMLTGLLVTGTFLSNAYYPLMYMGLGLAAVTLTGAPPLPDVAPSTAPDARSTDGTHRRIRRSPYSTRSS